MDLPRRSLFVWQLAPVVAAEGSAEAIACKAGALSIDGLFVKIAEGIHPYRNMEGPTGAALAGLRRHCADRGIALWGWHLPRCATEDDATGESAVVAEIADRLALDGLIMDAEPGAGFFRGGMGAAHRYGDAMRGLADRLGVPLGICGPALPSADPSWPDRFGVIAAHAVVSFPQVHYDDERSIEGFLAETEVENARFGLPIIPVGTAWVGEDGCASEQSCAARAAEFSRLCALRGHPGCAFWHWGSAPAAFWNVLAALQP